MTNELWSEPLSVKCRNYLNSMFKTNNKNKKNYTKDGNFSKLTFSKLNERKKSEFNEIFFNRMKILNLKSKIAKLFTIKSKKLLTRFVN